MAKKNTKYSFSKGILSKHNDEYILTEISKDDTTDYNLSKIFDSFIGSENISISIGADDEVPIVTE